MMRGMGKQAEEAAAAEEGDELAETPGTAGSSNFCYSLPVLQAILAFSGLAGAVEARNTLLVLLWQYPVSEGGFGFSPQQVSIILVSGGFGPILCHLAFFQKLAKLGFLKILVLGLLLNGLVYGLYPVYGLFANHSLAVRFAILGLAEFLGMIGTFLLFSAVFVFVNRASQGLNRATVNGWANSGRAFSRAVAPLLASQCLENLGCFDREAAASQSE